MNSPASLRVAVLGGGVTGLTAAWHLRRGGSAPVVFEKSLHPGGVVSAVREDDWLHELGPNSLLEGSADVARFIDDLGLGPRRRYAAPEAKQRYIVRAGRLVALPASPRDFIRTPLFSLGAKLNLIGEPFRRRGDPAKEESVAEFVLRRLGRDFLDYAINPLVGGVYAGDPARLSLPQAFPKLYALEQEHGSLLWGALKKRNASGGPQGRIFSFPEGLGEIPRALARALGGAVRLGTAAKTIRRREAGWEIESCNDRHFTREVFDAVVCAVPADALAAIAFENVPAARELRSLREIQHPPVASVFLGFRRADVAHPLDGFGVLMPEVERCAMLGTLFSSTLFPGRAPLGHVALTSFVGGMRQPELARLEDAELLRVVQAELERLLGVRAGPVYTHLQRWPRAIPQYAVGYARFKAAMADVESSAPGLFIGGNARDGISLANCIASGASLARRVRDAAGSLAKAREPALT